MSREITDMIADFMDFMSIWFPDFTDLYEKADAGKKTIRKIIPKSYPSAMSIVPVPGYMLFYLPTYSATR